MVGISLLDSRENVFHQVIIPDVVIESDFFFKFSLERLY